MLQVRLLSQLCQAVSSDWPERSRVERQGCLSLSQTGEECLASLGLLAVLVSRAGQLASLGEVLGLLAMLARIHLGSSPSLLPASLPLLTFSQAATGDQSTSREQETSDSEMSDGDLAGDHQQHQADHRADSQVFGIIGAINGRRIGQPHLCTRGHANDIDQRGGR